MERPNMGGQPQFGKRSSRLWAPHGACWEIVLLLTCLPFTALGDDPAPLPPPGFETELERGGPRDLARFEDAIIEYGRSKGDWKVPHESLRQFCQLAGLPAGRGKAFVAGHPKLRHTPEAIKRALAGDSTRFDWEIWRLHVGREVVSWTAQVSSQPPLPAPFRPGHHHTHSWVIDPRQNQPPGWDASLLGDESLWVREMPVNSGSGGVTLVHWRLDRPGTRYVTPRLRLADLKTCAPWFHGHLPDYVLARQDWFHHYEMRSIAIYLDHTLPKSSSMVEIQGSFAFETKAPEKRFDTHFDPATFRRIHLRGEHRHNALNLARPSRAADILILDAPADQYRVRFLSAR